MAFFIDGAEKRMRSRVLKGHGFSPEGCFSPGAHPIFSHVETTTTLGVPHPFRVLCGKGGIADARTTTSQIRAQHELEGAGAFMPLKNKPARKGL